MTAEASATDRALADYLAKLLRSHDVAASARGDRVLVDDDESRWVRLSAAPEPGAPFVRLHVDAAGPGGAVVSDSVTGWRDDVASSTQDALLHFCVGDFHVLLAGLWGVLEEDQVRHHVVSAVDGSWDLYLGSWVSRMSDPARTIVAPDAAFTEALLRIAPELLRGRRVMAGRVYVAVVRGEWTYEAMVDLQANDALDAVLRALPLVHDVVDYGSQRLFFLAVARADGPAHARVGRCAER